MWEMSLLWVICSVKKRPLFFQVKYILNIHTDWALCGKLLILLSFNHHYYSYLVKYENDWTVLDPFEVIDFHAVDQGCRTPVLECRSSTPLL